MSAIGHTLASGSSKQGYTPDATEIITYASSIEMHPKPIIVLLPVGVHAHVSPIMNMG